MSTTTPASTSTASSSSAPPPAPTIEQLPTNIPRLELDGSNWAIFSIRFQEAMEATDRWGYFDGTVARPTPADPDNPTAAERESMAKWDRNDRVARYLLSQRLPDSTAVRMHVHHTAKARWDRVTDEFTAKSAYVQNDLETTFREMKCPKDRDARAFFTSLRYKREELSAAGVSITDKEYQRTVLRGIPAELATFAASLLSGARIFSSNPTIDTETLIEHLCEEADQLKTRRGKSQSNKQSGGKNQAAADDALAATGSEGKKKRRKGKCHNCGKPGHWARECRSQKKEEKDREDKPKQEKPENPEKPQKSETKPVGSANAVATSDSDSDGCWATDLADVRLGPEELALIDESDWLYEEDDTAAAVITDVSADCGERVELYDLLRSSELTSVELAMKL